MVARNKSDQPSWTIRRRIIFSTLAYCALLNLIIIARQWLGIEMSEPVVQSYIMQTFLLSGGVVGSYVFGAVWDDKGR